MKQRITELAIFGGRPAFPEPLHVGRPNLGDRDRLLGRLATIIDSRWLSNEGRFVQEFERLLAARIGARHCVAVCNATVGLEIAIRAGGLTGEVIVPSFTFIATAHALQWQGITPVFCDIDPRTHLIDPDRIEALITERTTGIIGVHLWGRPCDIERLEAVAARHGLKLLFDAAHGFGCSHRGRPLGTFGAAEVMSFHATKILNSAEGGAILTDDDALAAKARLMRNFGFVTYDDVRYVGINGKMSEISAAFGLTNLESVDDFIVVNKARYEQYRRNLDGLPGLTFLEIEERPGDHRNFQYVVVEIDEHETGLSRDDLLRVLTAERVLARRYFWPGCHRMEPYRTLFPQAAAQLPETERIAERVMVLPTGTALAKEDVDVLSDLISFAISHHAEIVDGLKATAPDA
jgi:dTDP-4-amino-4,6-dideoxygalactose transaminase